MKIYSASDYAGLETERFSFYYGYEIELDGEWAFEAKDKNGNILMVLKFKELDCADMFECQSCLLAGIGEFLDTFTWEIL